MTRLRFLPVAGVLLATILTVTACGAASVSNPAAAPGTRHAAPVTGAASTSATPADTGATTPAGSPSVTTGAPPGQAVSPTPPPADQAAFADALASWKNAAAATAATMNFYLLQAVNHLRGSGYPGSDTAINELMYLAHLPPTDDTPVQKATAQSDVRALDSFFGTPGLMS